MKHIYILITLCLVTFSSSAQNVNIPNATLKAYLLSASSTTPIASDEIINHAVQTSGGVGSYTSIDTNGDGEIQVTEAQAITYLRIENLNITDFTGLEAFTQVKIYNHFNSVGSSSSVNFAIFPHLQWIELKNYWVSTLDLTLISTLSGIVIQNSLIDFMTLPQTVWGVYVYIYNTNIFSLDTYTCPKLNTLLLNNTSITTPLDLSNNTDLSEVNISNSNIEHLDLSNNPITTLSLSDNSSLTTVNLKNGSDFTSFWGASSPSLYLNIQNAPNLAHICVDPANIALTTSLVNNANTVINSYCDFIPGGNSYAANIEARIDVNNNGCDAQDPGLPFVNYNITGNGINTNVYGNSIGNLNTFLTSGQYTITPQLGTNFTASPTSFSANLSSASYTNSLCVTANTTVNDLEVIAYPYFNPTPNGGLGAYRIIYKNTGLTTQSGVITLNYNTNEATFQSAIPAETSHNNGTITWNFANIAPFETRTIEVNIPLNTGLTLGNTVTNTVNITSAATDVTPNNNTFTLNQIVETNVLRAMANTKASKTCLEGETITVDNIGGFLHYAIRFENNSTNTATNIVATDVIDNTKLDINSLQIVDASHTLNTNVNGNTVEFIFKDINLSNTTNNSGFVIFKLKTLPSVQVNDVINNSAKVFFDLKAPKTSNTTTITVTQNSLNTTTVNTNTVLTIAPNPAVKQAVITATANIKLVSVYNNLGQIIQKANVIGNTKTFNLNVSNYSKGLYFITIETKNGSVTKKLLKQ